jgi:hypothetical protein
MIVNTSPTRPPRLISKRQPPDIPPIIIRPQKCNVIRNCQSLLLVISLHFLVQTPHLGYLCHICPIEDFSQDLNLRLDGILHHNDRLLISEADCGVAAPTHRHGEETACCVWFGPLSAVAEEFLNGRVVGVVCPLTVASVLFAECWPLIRCSHHGF